MIIIKNFNAKEKYKHLANHEKEIFMCISCGDCREAIDITNSKWGVCVAREHTNGFEPYFGRGKMQIIRSIWENKLNLSEDLAEVFYQCPVCNACSITCAYNFNNAELYEALRAELVDAGFRLSPHISMDQSMAESLNPYGRDNKEKSNWLKMLDFNIKDASLENADILYFVGCTAAFTPEIQTIAINTAKLLRKLNIDFSVFSNNEICCGSVSLRTGYRNTFNSIAKRNYELFKNSGVRAIITSCAGCYRTLKIDYKEILQDLEIPVYHTIEYIHKLMKEKNIELKDLGLKVTYHDPCHVGRHIGLYEEPRELLNKVSSLLEMKTTRENAKCCGAGGGVKKSFSKLSLDIAMSRIEEAEETGADFIISICPFCFRNLNDAIKQLNSKLKMVDLIELINKAIY
ncbi:MAG: (Fe-S)-binding protein [Candidatus Helarchaeota archaeon]